MFRTNGLLQKNGNHPKIIFVDESPWTWRSNHSLRPWRFVRNLGLGFTSRWTGDELEGTTTAINDYSLSSNSAPRWALFQLSDVYCPLNFILKLYSNADMSQSINQIWTDSCLMMCDKNCLISPPFRVLLSSLCACQLLQALMQPIQMTDAMLIRAASLLCIWPESAKALEAASGSHWTDTDARGWLICSQVSHSKAMSQLLGKSQCKSIKHDV